MAQRRTPVGQPARRPGPSGRQRTTARPVRSAARPASARRAGAAGAAKHTTAPQPRRLTGRAAVLALLLFGLLLAYAYPIRVYLTQQAEIATLEQEQAVQSAHIADLAVERAKWDDPEFIKAQARKRFQLVERGDRTYIVIFDPVSSVRTAGEQPNAANSGEGSTWYGRLWSSIDAANQPPDQ